MSELLAFALLALVLSVTPGPDALLVLRSTARGGRRAGLATAAGTATGSLAWALATAVGLAAVLARSAHAYEVIRWAGATYLIGLGVTTLLGRGRRAGKPPANPGSWAVDGGGPAGGVGRLFGAGLFSDLLNPKVGLFYLAVVPQFVPTGAPLLQYSLLLAAIEVAIALAWLSALACAAGAALAWLRRPRVDLALQRLLGVGLVGAGAAVVLERP